MMQGRGLRESGMGVDDERKKEEMKIGEVSVSGG